MNRIKIIESQIPSCKVFADVGCDHGYVTELMLKHQKCQVAYITDISKKCLEKAENLLKDQIALNKCKSFVADGFTGVPQPDTALIAGMGGEEIVKILKNSPYKIENLVLNPMKNFRLVREYLVNNGYKILTDFTFFSGKYYQLIRATLGSQSLTEEQLELGLTNVENPSQDFKNYAYTEIKKLNKLVEKQEIKLADKEIFIQKINRLKKYVN